MTTAAATTMQDEVRALARERDAVILATADLLRAADEERPDDLVRERLQGVADDRRIVLPVDQDQRPRRHDERTSSSIRAVYFSNERVPGSRGH